MYVQATLDRYARGNTHEALADNDSKVPTRPAASSLAKVEKQCRSRQGRRSDVEFCHRR
jgi:hypothetical protein